MILRDTLQEVGDALALMLARGWTQAHLEMPLIWALSRARWTVNIEWTWTPHPTTAMRFIVVAMRGPIPPDDPRRKEASKQGRVYVYKPYYVRRTCEAGELVDVLLQELRWIDEETP